jgi:hypothetical protein
MNSFDYFCHFAWGHLDDVFQLDETEGLPKFSPYVEFTLGCALTALADLPPRIQKQRFGFTVKELVNKSPDHDFGIQFYRKYSKRALLCLPKAL